MRGFSTRPPAVNLSGSLAPLKGVTRTPSGVKAACSRWHLVMHPCHKEKCRVVVLQGGG